jgi:uncharacterized protein
MIEMALLGGAAMTGAAAGAALLAFYPPLLRDLGGAPDLDGRARRVLIPVAGDDGVDGWWLEGPAPSLVLLFHGYGRTHTRTWRYGAFLNAAGHSVLTLDFRSSRAVRRLPTTLGHHEGLDAEAALAWVAREPSLAGRRIGVFGESLGGAVALRLAGEHPEVAAVAVDCAFSDGALAIEDASQRWAHLPRAAGRAARVVGRAVTGVDPGALAVEPWAERLGGRPAFFIHALRDDRLSPEHARRLWRAAGAKDPLWLIEGAGHNEGWRRRRADYERALTAFFDHALLDRGAGVPAGEHHDTPPVAAGAGGTQ